MWKLLLALAFLPFYAVAGSDGNPFENINNLDVVVDEEDCKAMNRKRNLSASYQPGVDVRGNPVKSADVGMGSDIVRIPDTITIPLKINAFTFLDNARAAQIFSDPEIGLGEVKVNLLNGDVTINSVKISDQTTALLQNACRNKR